jgi:hypothetical protein
MAKTKNLLVRIVIEPASNGFIVTRNFMKNQRYDEERLVFETQDELLAWVTVATTKEK